MKVCLPLAQDYDTSCLINKDFDSANDYMICDTITMMSAVMTEKDLMAEYGADNALAAIIAGGVTTIITKDINPAAFVVIKRRTKLRLFTAESRDPFENIELFKADKLTEIKEETLEFTSPCSGGCSSCASTSCKPA